MLIIAGGRKRTHFKAAIEDSGEGAGDIEAPLDLSDAALHIRAAKSFRKENKCKRDQKELQRHIVEQLSGQRFCVMTTAEPLICAGRDFLKSE